MSFEDMIFEEMNGHTVEEDKIFVRGYNQALEDVIEKIGNYIIVCNDGVTEIVEMKEIIRCKEQLIK